MEITNEQLAWDSEDVAVFLTFLKTRTGSRLLPKLAESVPTLLEEGDSNKIAIRSGKVLGFQECIKNILQLASPQPENPRSADNYPPLEDDKAHNDGQTLT